MNDQSEEIRNLIKERDALRLAFAEASHNAGPAFVAHEELKRLKSREEISGADAWADECAKLSIELSSARHALRESEASAAAMRDALDTIAAKFPKPTEDGRPWPWDTTIVLTPADRQAIEQALSNTAGTSLLARLAELESDRARLDWLERKTVNVRVPLVHGTRTLFWSSPDDDEDENAKSNIREAIDQARGGSGL